MVEWKKLGEIGDVCMCKRIMKNQTFDKGDVPFYKIGTFGGNADAFISKDLFHEYKSRFSFPQKGEILLSASGTIGRTVVYNGEDAYFQDSNIVWISNDETQVTNAFLYYCYQIVDWKIDGGTIKRLYNYNLKNTIIPIPSLSEQNRIVGILDTFTASIDNLKEQIAQRRKQYEYYRDQLLDLEGKEGVEMKTLGELSYKISSGRNKNKEDQGLYPVFGSTGIIAYTNSYLFDKQLILVARVGANAGYVYMINEKCDVTDNTLIIETKEDNNRKFIYYYLVYMNINQFAKGGGQPLITGGLLKEISIPLPSLQDQQRIVSILDTFEASIQNLEAQLSQREKQYEYYRNKLLTFE